MLTSEAKRKLTAGGMFGLPMALVWLTARVIGGPESAEASQTGNLAVAPLSFHQVDVAAPTPAQSAAAARVDALLHSDFGPTPFHHRRAGETPVVIENPEDSSVPRFSVKLIMATSSGNRAVIDGKVYQVGDKLGDTGWVIVSIDAQTRSVSIRDPRTERVRMGTVDSPSLK